SKVFAAIGREIPAGMAMGIERAAGLVDAAVSGLATSATLGVSVAGTAPALTAPAASFVPQGRAGGTTVQSLNLTVQGADLDFRNPSAAARQLLVHIRDGLRDLDREQM